jgi:DNA-binding winged helix-turn-helix (wHTH) protein
MDHKCFVFRFGDIEVKEREFLLIKSGEAAQVEPKAFRVLLLLLRNPGRLVTKDEILSTIWSDVAVSDDSLTRSIFILRRLLGDDTREPRYIETVHTVGYRFLCEVAVREDGFIAEIETDASVAPGLPGGHVLVASKLMGSAHPQSDRLLHEFEEPVARMQPVSGSRTRQVRTRVSKHGAHSHHRGCCYSCFRCHLVGTKPACCSAQFQGTAAHP